MIKIKELEWTMENGSWWYADSVVGRFVVIDGTWTLKSRMKHVVPCRDDETAKAASQAHFESLIRSTIQD